MLHAHPRAGLPAPSPAAHVPLTAVIDRIGRLPPPLVSNAALRALRRVTDQIPAALSNRLYVECRLAAGAPRVDLVICVDRDNRAVLTHHAERALAERVRMHPVWTGVLHLFDWWARGASPSSRAVTETWLEFDALPDNVDPTVPCVFLAFPRESSRPDVLAATLGGLAFLREAPFGAGTVSAVSHAVSCLPPAARVAYSGLMCSRNLDSIRLCIANLKRDRVLGYLQDVGWAGRLGDLTDAMQMVACGSVPDPRGSIALLHIDVGTCTGPRLGMEICFDRPHQLRTSTRERDLLDRLCAMGLSAPRKCGGLLAWPGHSLERFAHERAPSIVVRRVNGIKLVHVAHEGFEAKAYLTAFHQVRRETA